MTKLISFQLSMHSGGLLSAQELYVLSYVYTIPYNVLCRHETLFDTVKKNNNNNGSGLEQVVHTHVISDRCGWPRGFFELNIPVLTSEYFLTCQLVPVLAPTYSRSRSAILQSDHLFTLHQSVAKSLSDRWRSTGFLDWRCAASLRYRNCAEIIALMCEQKHGFRSGMVWK